VNDEPWIDLVDGAFYVEDPYAAFAWMRRHEPVYFDEAHGLWGITKHRDIKEISKDPATFSSAGGIRPDVGPLPMMIDMDAPAHIERRKLVSAGFTPMRVRSMEAEVRRICDAIIDEVAQVGQCDLVSDIAAPLPLIVIGNMLGFAPEDRGDLLRWSDDLLRAQGSDDIALVEAMFAAFSDYTEYMHGVIADRRRTGESQDLTGILVHAGAYGHGLDDDSLVHETLLILIGGDETTRHVISGGLEALLRHADQLAALRADAALLPRAVEEMLRWVTPIKNMARTTTRDVALRGTTIPKGDQLLLLYPSGNRDEEVFDEPDRFDVGRAPNDHVAFGFGAHFCLGNQLARMEMRVMVEQLVTRLPDLARADDSPLAYREANFISGIESMPVIFTPVAVVGAGPA
jgi:cytochrome P450 family 142 subfamily A polypeptide 1